MVCISKNFTLKETLQLCFSFIKRRILRSETIFATESPLKIMKNAYYFNLKALFVLKTFIFLLWLFGHVQKQHD